MIARLGFALLALLLWLAPAAAQDQRAFQRWLADELWPQAAAAGVSQRTFAAATRDLRLDLSLPDLALPGAPPRTEPQAEFRSPGAYFDEKRLNALVRGGRDRLKTWQKTLAAIERQTGVPAGIVIAIWGRESAFGSAAIPENAISTLATHAFVGRRKALFRAELIAALQILERGDVAPGAMKSSWAGALGQPQFLPSKFFTHAADFDGDGRADIWDSVPDTLASIANYLRVEGWQAGRPWGFEVTVPASLPCTLEGPDQGKPMAEWLRLGVTPLAGALPRSERNQVGYLLMPAGRFGPAFLVTPNFYAIKAYNESDLYALFIGHLGDRLRDNRAFAGAWAKVGGFTRGDVQAMQERLQRDGHDVGGADGLIGFRTRVAVGRWQAANGRDVTCLPDAAMIRQVR